LQVIYLVLSEGYFATSGETVIRTDLTGEAIRLTRLLGQLLPEPEVNGLLALMLLHESRRAARTDTEGNLILLDEQDRSLWNGPLIAEGTALVEDALRSRRFGPYTIQAAISAVHATSPSAEATDWVEIVGLYDVLLAATPSPVVELNRAVAVAMRDDPQDGVALIDGIFAAGNLLDYPLAWSTHGELLRRSGEFERALVSYRTALDLSQQEPARRYLQERIDALRTMLAS
jgi:RNA polymerase sigma-70 factor (ECF subfamily)